MKEKDIYLFLDWSLTINELIKSDKLMDNKFKNFVRAIEKLEASSNAKIKLVIISGTKKSLAQKRFDILKQAFADVDRDDIFLGFGFEYGSYMINKANKIIKMLNFPLSLKEREAIAKITKTFGFEDDKEYETYFNIEFAKFEQKHHDFVAYCKENLKDLDFEVYNDKYGHGIDIKKPLLNKGNFVELFIKKYTDNDIYLMIVGGDSVQDTKMISDKYNCQTYFIGFSDKLTEFPSKSVLSKKENIDGIIECIEKICNFKIV